MRKSPLTMILLALLMLNALGAFWFSYQFGRYLKNVQVLQHYRNDINKKTGIFQALLADTMEYSKRNPAIDPLLQSANLKPKPGAAATAPLPSPNQ